MLQSLETKTLT